MNLEMAFGAVADLADDPEGFSKPGSCDPSLNIKTCDAHRTTGFNWTPLSDAATRAIAQALPETQVWSDAETEIALCQPASCDHAMRDRLRALGVIHFAGRAADPFDALCSDQVVFLPGDLFEFARNMRDQTGALSAVVIPVRDCNGDLIDLAAWQPDANRLALWRGRVPMLGADNILRTRPRLEEPLEVHENALDWLRANREGVFLICHRRAADWLDGLTLAATTAAHGERLRQKLTRPASPIVIRRPQA